MFKMSKYFLSYEIYTKMIFFYFFFYLMMKRFWLESSSTELGIKCLRCLNDFSIQTIGQVTNCTNHYGEERREEEIEITRNPIKRNIEMKGWQCDPVVAVSCFYALGRRKIKRQRQRGWGDMLRFIIIIRTGGAHEEKPILHGKAISYGGDKQPCMLIQTLLLPSFSSL